MAILCDKTTKVLVQGVGRMGQFHAKLSREYGTQVVGGVAPGKGGTTVADMPIYDTVSEAVQQTGANASMIFVPPPGAADAILEAADAGIELAICVTEGIPVVDMACAKRSLADSPMRLVGPNCPGVVTPSSVASASCRPRSRAPARAASFLAPARSPTKRSISSHVWASASPPAWASGATP